MSVLYIVFSVVVLMIAFSVMVRRPRLFTVPLGLLTILIVAGFSYWPKESDSYLVIIVAVFAVACLDLIYIVIHEIIFAESSKVKREKRKNSERISSGIEVNHINSRGDINITSARSGRSIEIEGIKLWVEDGRVKSNGDLSQLRDMTDVTIGGVRFDLKRGRIIYR